MKGTGTAVKLGFFWLVLLVFTVTIVIVFGQMRFNRTTGYSALFTNASGLRAGQFVRAAGVEIGKVAKVTLIDGDTRVLVDFAVDSSLPLDQATTASIRYLNLIGERYLELKHGDSGRRLPPGATIPLEHTQPALDLDALIGGFRPLFKALDPDKVNSIAQSIITVFQGQGATINDILDQTASLTATLADRDQAIGEIIDNLNTVLATTVKHQKEFDRTVDKLEAADHRTEEQGRSAGRGGSTHQRRRGNAGRPARRGPTAAAQHLRTPRGHSAAAHKRSADSRRRAGASCRTHTGSSAAPAASTATSSTSTCATSR